MLAADTCRKPSSCSSSGKCGSCGETEDDGTAPRLGGGVARLGQHLDDATLRVGRSETGCTGHHAVEMRAILGWHFLAPDTFHDETACFGAQLGRNRLNPPLAPEQTVE